MGNQITATAPAQILPLESYFNELTEYSKPISLGSTRLFKVARARHSDGVEVVVKVFPKHDEKVQLGPYDKRLTDQKIRLHGVLNALPFQKFWETDRAAFLVRQHIRFNLYDRLSTRPFLSTMEKKWIVFQLLKVLEECHTKKICHGDIKTENVLLTGWDWVLLSDFASFKPTTLPDDNPAEFSFFFDTSRRRTCYIAPERFTAGDVFQELNAGMQQRTTGLTPQMDIFSLGCVIAELFMDGRPLFDLSQLLDYYHKEKEATEATLKKIPDRFIRRMVRSMIHLQPEERFTAQEYLQLYRGDVFPEFFYSFLHGYFKHFCITSKLTPDQCIQKLYVDLEAILANLLLDKRKQDREIGYGDGLVIILSAITSHLRVAQFVVSKIQALEMMKTISHHVTDECILERIVPFLVLLIRDKQWASVRAEAVRTLSHCLSLVKYLPGSDFNLFPEYILPILHHIPSDRDVMVRMAFAECIAEVANTAHRFLELAQLKANQDDDSSVIQYQVQGSYDSELLQLQESFQSSIVHLLSDADSSVKRSFLKHSAARLCVFFGPQRAKEVILSHMITFLNDKTDWELHRAFFECIVDVATLLRHHSLPILEPLLQQGLSDSEETVVRMTIEAMTTLCEENLFDQQTLLENVSSLVPYLVHPDIWIKYSAIGFLLSAAGQLDEVDVQCYILPRVLPFLKYPIIQMTDLGVLLSSLREPVPRGVLDFIIKHQNIREIYECLTDRQMARNIAREGEEPDYKEIEDPNLIKCFKKLQSLGLDGDHENSLMALKEHVMKQHYNKQQFSEVDFHYQASRGVIDLKNLNISVTPRHLDLVYKNPVRQQQQQPPARRRTSAKPVAMVDKSSVNEDWDRIFGETPASKPARQQQQVTTPTATPTHGSSSASGSSSTSRPHGGSRSSDHSPERQLRSPRKKELQPQVPAVAAVMMREGDNPLQSSSDTALLRPPPAHGGIANDQLNISPRGGGAGGSAVVVGDSSTLAPGSGLLNVAKSHKRSRSDGAIHNVVTERSELDSPSAGDRTLNKVELASCKEDLKKLLQYKQQQYTEDMRAMDNDLAKTFSFQSSPGWTPKGQLIAHINEHKSSINRICAPLDSSIFATFSDDGSTKIWDMAKLEGRNHVNRAKFTYSAQGGQIKAGVFCHGNRSVAAASSTGSIQVFSIQSKKTGQSRRQLLLDSRVDPANYGMVVELASFTAGGQDVVCFATTRGKLCGLDLRSNQMVWELTNEAKYGLSISMAVDPFENWVAVGTSLGYHVIWDMRFQLPIRKWQHTGHGGKPHVHHVYRLCAHPTQQSSLISAVSGNNEVSIWDMETASRRQMLWASPAQPFSEMTDNHRQHESVRGLSPCIIDNSPVVLSGGTDRFVRLWNLSDPAQCSCVIKPKQYSKSIMQDYESKIIEGVDVFREIWTPTPQSANSSAPSSSSSPSAPSGTETYADSAHSHSHVDFVTDLAIVPHKHQFIVSASHDGVLKIWK